MNPRNLSLDEIMKLGKAGMIDGLSAEVAQIIDDKLEGWLTYWLEEREDDDGP